MTGNWLRSDLFFEYVLTGSFAPRGAGVSDGGIRLIGFTGTHPAGTADESLIGFKVVVVDGDGVCVCV